MSSFNRYAVRARFARFLGFELEHSQQRYWQALEEVIDPGADWLDLGCGWQITAEWAASQDKQLALAAASFDVVTANTPEAVRQGFQNGGAGGGAFRRYALTMIACGHTLA